MKTNGAYRQFLYVRNEKNSLAVFLFLSRRPSPVLQAREGPIMEILEGRR